MSLPTWEDLCGLYCTSKTTRSGGSLIKNPHYEELSNRRYNYSAQVDTKSFRLVFLKDVLKNPDNKTLRRKGRFIWTKNLRYEGRDNQGFRQISFTVDKGQKRFTVSERDVLCIPSKSYINNNQYFRNKYKTFSPFSSVFGYKNTLKDLAKNSGHDLEGFKALVEKDNPFKPGTLVSPRLGYFYPHADGGGKKNDKREHPVGIILGKVLSNSDYLGRELYRVRFGATTYEKIHPVQLEIINEV